MVVFSTETDNRRPCHESAIRSANCLRIDYTSGPLHYYQSYREMSKSGMSFESSMTLGSKVTPWTRLSNLVNGFSHSLGHIRELVGLYYVTIVKDPFFLEASMVITLTKSNGPFTISNTKFFINFSSRVVFYRI